jgi:hypothetical protein
MQYQKYQQELEQQQQEEEEQQQYGFFGPGRAFMFKARPSAHILEEAKQLSSHSERSQA